jgi:hypothetical protein
MAREQSSIGSSIYYGPRSVDNLGSSFGNTSGNEIYEWEFDFDELPGADADDSVVITLPAGAFIRSATTHVIETIVGPTSYTSGLIDPDGTVHDPDGFDTTNTSLTAGTSTVGAGALVGTELAKTGQLVFAFVGSAATAGRVKIRVVTEAT